MPCRHDQNSRLGANAGTEPAIHKHHSFAIGTDINVKVDYAWLLPRDGFNHMHIRNIAIFENPRVNRAQCLRIVPRRNEEHPARAIHRRAAFQCGRINAVNSAAIKPDKIILALREVNVRVGSRLVQVVEQQLSPITADERFHRVIIVAGNLYARRLVTWDISNAGLMVAADHHGNRYYAKRNGNQLEVAVRLWLRRFDIKPDQIHKLFIMPAMTVKIIPNTVTIMIADWKWPKIKDASKQPTATWKAKSNPASKILQLSRCTTL